MKKFAWAVAIWLVGNVSASAGEYWVCKPMQGATHDPRILISKGEGKSLYFQTDADLIRDEGRLPAGTYIGSGEASTSGFSLFAELDVTSFFPGGKLSLALSLKSTLFATEAYLLFPSESDPYAGTILNNYACKHHL